MKNGKVKVVVVMGSQSDLSVMKLASHLLSEWKVGVLTQIVSAHRTPELLQKSVREWEQKGVKVIIAGAGGAAHLPGMLASFSYLPVIGIPIGSKSMNGLDSLLSMAQMPKGVPVATVAVDNSINAALLAVQILAVEDSGFGESLKRKIISYKKTMSSKVQKHRKKLGRLGVDAFLKSNRT